MGFFNLIGGERPLHKDHDAIPLAPGVYDKKTQLKARTPEQVDGDGEEDSWDQNVPTQWENGGIEVVNKFFRGLFNR
ncbi:hypothetical protein EPO14_01440 [Patescibacteria group bacterium]|nr:MAG: hypothetical protein EPO14_01440 [Patescibacteria group bacterium]